MAVLKFKQGQFQVARNIATDEVYKSWIESRGAQIFKERHDALHFPWFFGNARTRFLLRKEMRKALSPRGDFAARLAQSLDELPLFTRKLANAIKKRGFKDMITVHEDRGLVVVPRGLVQHEFIVNLQKDLGEDRHLAEFPGLAKRVLQLIGREAEELLFGEISKGRPHPDSSGKGVLLEVDEFFRWRLNKLDGHYYYGFTTDENQLLTDRRTLNRFRNAMKEVMQAQVVHLKRLPDHERNNLTEAFRTGGATPPPVPATLPLL